MLLDFIQKSIRRLRGIPDWEPIRYPAALCEEKPANLGRAGEDLAAWYLENVMKLKILGRNEILKTPKLNQRVQGELDIIAKDDDLLLFIEVRTRSYVSPIYGGAASTIRYKKRLHVTRTARLWMRQNGVSDTIPVRFDVVIIIWNHGKPGLKYYPGAFTWVT